MPIGHSTLSNIARIRPFRSRRESSFDRSGGNRDAIPIKPGKRHTLAEIDGPACIKHIWSTNSHAHVRDACRSLVLRMWWDGEKRPSVEVPLVDFFGGGFGICRNFVSLPLQMNPDSGRGMNCYFPMPFREHARIEVHNEWKEEVHLFYYVDYELYAHPELLIRDQSRRGAMTAGRTKGSIGVPPVREARGSIGVPPVRRRSNDAKNAAGRLEEERPVGGQSPGSVDELAWDEELAYFHAQWRRENPTRGWGHKDLKGPANKKNLEWYWKTPNTTGDGNYVILEATGRGQYVGCHLDIDCFAREKNDWYGEGDDMIFIDGEPWPPSLHGTGTEDYFSGAYCPHEVFHTPYAGITQYSGSPTWTEHDWPFRGKNSMYRFHIEDPIRFERSIRVTIEHGHNNKLTNDYSSTAYWYQFEPHAPFPKLPPAKQRLARPDWPPFEAGQGVEPGPPA